MGCGASAGNSLLQQQAEVKEKLLAASTSSDWASLNQALQEAQQVQLTDDDEEVQKAKEVRGDCAKQALHSAALSDSLADLDEALSKGQIAQLDDSCGEVQEAREAKQSLAKAALVTAATSGSVEAIDSALGLAATLGFDDACGEVQAAKDAKKELAKADLRAAAVSDSPQAIDEALAQARVFELDDACEEVQAAKEAKKALAKAALASAVAAGSVQMISESLVQAAAAELDDLCEEVQEAKDFRKELAKAALAAAVDSGFAENIDEALAQGTAAELDLECEEVQNAHEAKKGIAHALLQQAIDSEIASSLREALAKARELGVNMEEDEFAKIAKHKLEVSCMVFFWEGPRNFNGDEAIEHPCSPELKLTQAWTVMVFVKPSQWTVPFTRIIGRGAHVGLWIDQNGGPLAQALGVNPPGAATLYLQEQAIPVGQWTHIAQHFTQNGMHELLVNGIPVMGQNSNGALSLDDGSLTLAKGPYHGGFIGEMRDARIYNYAMTSEQIDNMVFPPIWVDPLAELISVPLTSPVALRLKRQATVDPEVVKHMVKPEDLPSELKMEQEIMSVNGGVPCFLCKGAGFSTGTVIQNNDAPPPGKVASSNDVNSAEGNVVSSFSAAIWLVENVDGGWDLFGRQIAELLEEALQDGEGACVHFNNSTIDLERRLQINITPNGEIQRAVLRLASSDDTSVTWLFDNGKGGWGLFGRFASSALEAVRFMDPATNLTLRGPRFKYKVDLDARTQTNISTGTERKVHRVSPDSDTAAPDESEGEICWVCQGTGKTSKWLSCFEVQRDEQERPCLVCYGDSKYGLSEECDHFYCETCIVGSLEAIQSSGQFPAFCPQCRADAGKDPDVGQITHRTLTFLQERGVITKEFQFRFITANSRALLDEQEEYFQCPAGCGNCLLLQQPAYLVDGAQPFLRMAQCACRALICLKCRTQVEEGQVHKCEDEEDEKVAADEVEKALEEDDEFLASIAALGKKCPVCSCFIQKNEGCDSMSCGTFAHGKLGDCIRNGGCGILFQWSTLSVPPSSNWQDLDGTNKQGQPVTARQIKEHPKCKRPECPYFKTTDGLGPGIVAPSGLQKFHTAVGTQAPNNGGEYCCDACERDGTHQMLCHHIRYDEKHRKPVKGLTSVSGVETAPTKFLEPFLARYVQITCPKDKIRPPIRSSKIHAQLLGQGNQLFPSLSSQKLHFGEEGFHGDNWQHTQDLGSEKRVVGIRTDAGRLAITLHYSLDAVSWTAYTGSAP